MSCLATAAARRPTSSSSRSARCRTSSGWRARGLDARARPRLRRDADGARRSGRPRPPATSSRGRTHWRAGSASASSTGPSPQSTGCSPGATRCRPGRPRAARHAAVLLVGPVRREDPGRRVPGACGAARDHRVHARGRPLRRRRRRATAGSSASSPSTPPSGSRSTAAGSPRAGVERARGGRRDGAPGRSSSSTATGARRRCSPTGRPPAVSRSTSTGRQLARAPARRLTFVAVACLGSPHNPDDTDVPEVAAELDVHRRAPSSRDVPVLGLCFGGQVLANVLGGTDQPRADARAGLARDRDRRRRELVPAGPWLQWHFHRFTLPPGAAELARSPARLQAFRHGRHLGVQFHPESTIDIVARLGAHGRRAPRARSASPTARRCSSAGAATTGRPPRGLPTCSTPSGSGRAPDGGDDRADPPRPRRRRGRCPRTAGRSRRSACCTPTCTASRAARTCRSASSTTSSSTACASARR